MPASYMKNQFAERNSMSLFFNAISDIFDYDLFEKHFIGPVLLSRTYCATDNCLNVVVPAHFH